MYLIIYCIDYAQDHGQHFNYEKIHITRTIFEYLTVFLFNLLCTSTSQTLSGFQLISNQIWILILRKLYYYIIWNSFKKKKKNTVLEFFKYKEKWSKNKFMNIIYKLIKYIR